jgi:hypothetical protein
MPHPYNICSTGRATLQIRLTYLNPQAAPQQLAIETFWRCVGQTTSVGVVDPAVSVELDCHRHANVGEIRLSLNYYVIWYQKLHLHASQNVTQLSTISYRSIRRLCRYFRSPRDERFR